MEAMMSSMLATASARLYGQSDVPLDLSWSKTHSCERFVNTEDLRTETYLAQSDGDISTISSVSSSDDDNAKLTTQQDSVGSKWYSFPSPSSGTSVTPPLFSSSHVSPTIMNTNNISSDNTVKSERDSAPSVRSSHSFSIESILGTYNSESSENSETDKESEPAQVYSSYMAAISGSFYLPYIYASLGTIHQQPLTSTPAKSGNTEPVEKSKKLFWCHKCYVFCSDNLDADRHRQVHSCRADTCNLKRLLFKECGYVSKHEQTDYLDRIECGLCKKVVAHCFFMKHMSLHDGHVCEVCDHEFSTNSKLQDHMNIHSGAASFSCKQCNRTFSKRSSLTQHNRYHREYKSFDCRFCPKSFNSKYTCTVHERIHTGETPFKCEKPGCNKGFPQKIQLRLHMATHRKRGEL